MAAIVHADVAGSTALVQLDETLTHERINQVFSRFSQCIEHYGGTVREIRGDALVAEFPRASDAVCAALGFQKLNKQVLAELADPIAPTVRIGVSLGEAIFADGQVTGAGVVLAQRVEQLAEPGGICVTGAIHEAVPQHMPLVQASLGEQELKGFEETIRVYRVALKPGKDIPPPENTQNPKTTNTLGISAAVAAMVLAIVGGVAFWYQTWAPEEEPASVERMAFPLPDKPSIAVLPFTNMSGDPEQEYFADGVTEDLTTDLSRISGLFVIASNSAFAYKNRSMDVAQVASELGVRYILGGSVRRAGNQVRINAQLIEAATGGQLWGEKYDGTLDDVFGLQDQVTNNITTVLAVRLSTGDRERTSLRQTGSGDAYDAFLKGWNRYLSQTPDGYSESIDHFKRAIEIDPAYSRAYAALAATYWQGWKRFWHEAIGEWRWHNARVQAEQYLRKSMEHPTAPALQLSSAMDLQRGDIDAAVAKAENAIAMDPNDPEGYITLAGALSYRGDPSRALTMVEKAMQVNPYFPPYYLYELGLAQFGIGQLEAAADAFEKAVAANPMDVWSQRMLLATYGQLGRGEDATTLRDKLLNLHPLEWLSIKSAIFWHPFELPADIERFTDGLRNAGVPE